MTQRNLLQDPCWEAKDLGEALPNSPHAVSVALPRWQDVIAYEEKENNCMSSLKAIYPRFGLNPLVSEVAQHALKINKEKEFNTAWPYPNHSTVNKAKAYCSSISKNGSIKVIEVLGLQCLLANENSTPAAKSFWQHTGLGASSREAAIALNKEIAPSPKAGAIAKELITQRLSEIYGCQDEFITLYPSGMAALTNALSAISIIHPNRPTLQIGFPYVDVLKLPQVIFSGSKLVLNTNPNHIKRLIKEIKPSAIIVELPSNPMLQCVDIKTISEIANERDIPLIADDTIGSPLNINALSYADLVFSSLTKSFAGKGDILAGSLVVNPKSKWNQILKEKIQQSAICELANADAIALEEASQDVFTRIPLLNQACMTLKAKLQEHPSVARVFHPADCPNYQKLLKDRGGYGCLVSFELTGGIEATKNFYNSLKVCKGPSLGTNFSLACPYVLLAHYEELDWAKSCGVPPHLIRVSVGLEKPQILWERFEKALNNQT